MTNSFIPFRAGVPKLWDLMPDDWGCSWCNNNRNKEPNKCNALELPWSCPLLLPQSVKKLSSMKLVPGAKNVGDLCFKALVRCWLIRETSPVTLFYIENPTFTLAFLLLLFVFLYSTYHLSDSVLHLFILLRGYLLQFSSVQLLSCVWLFATPRTAARPASLSITKSRSLLKHMSIEPVMPSRHLILQLVINATMAGISVLLLYPQHVE